MMLGELDEKAKLKRAGGLLNSVIKGLNEINLETRQKIIELYGEPCACEDGDLDIAKKIAEECTC
ncbi:hypothetical protein KAU92_02290 [Candidatus Bathyarchaeota archaeon]|nr:hypothetical protein [Candidatus Bathyarchaeota archaeon]